MSVDATKGAAEAARQSISLLVSKERARIRVDSVQIHLTRDMLRDLPESYLPQECDRIEFRVFCSGVTPAFISDAQTKVWLSEFKESHEPNPGEGSPLHLPKVLEPSDKAIIRTEPIDPEIDMIIERQSSPEEKHSTVFLNFGVLIRYADVFQVNKRWEMQSRYLWTLTYHRSGETGFFSWTDDAHHDSEKEIDGAN